MRSGEGTAKFNKAIPEMGRERLSRISLLWTRLFWNRYSRLAAVLSILCGLGLLAPRAAWAHAELVSSRPAANSTVTGPNVAIVLRYDSRVDATRSTVTLLGPQGKIRKIAVSAQSAPNQLSAKVTGLTAKGAYMLRWQALASDGHITRGEVPFRVQ